METDESNDIDSITNDIVSQLKNTINTPAAVPSQNTIQVTPENLEQFIVDQSSSLVNQAMQVVGSLKDYVATGADAKEISAFAEVVNAATGAIESLNKMHATITRTKTAIQLKEMDIEARIEIADQDNTTKLVLGREEMLKRLIEDSRKVIDV